MFSIDCKKKYISIKARLEIEEELNIGNNNGFRYG
jgi:hypothetical protein